MPATVSKDTGQMIKQARLKKKMSQEELSKRIEQEVGRPISHTQVSKWETGLLVPRLDMMKALESVKIIAGTNSLFNLQTVPEEVERQKNGRPFQDVAVRRIMGIRHELLRIHVIRPVQDMRKGPGAGKELRQERALQVLQAKAGTHDKGACRLTNIIKKTKGHRT